MSRFNFSSSGLIEIDLLGHAIVSHYTFYCHVDVCDVNYSDVNCSD